MTPESPLVSVVTPFYNTAEYLGQCIESVLHQTYRNFEYILIDNRSSDGSSRIAEDYARRFPERIRLVQTSSFLSQVENYAFALTQISPNSKYCKMVQADDLIFEECLQKMVDLAEGHPQVGIVGAYELEGDHVALSGLPYPSDDVLGRDICRLYFLQYIYLFGTPTSLMFRSDLVRARVPFYEERFAPFEDAQACFELLKGTRFGFVHQVLTYSRRQEESTLARIRPFRFLLFARLLAVVTQGRNFLSGAEYRACLKDAEEEYFIFLGICALTGQPAAFWKFHREALASIGYRLNWRFWTKWIPLALLEYCGNPKRTLDSIWTRRRKRSTLSNQAGVTLRAGACRENS